MPATRLDNALRHPALLLILWGAAVTLVAVYVDHFWIPLDDGTLGQSAERVLAGQLPHRDFGDPYTGLNAMVGALAFKLFGVSLLSLRMPLVAGFALWLPGVWLVARRFSGAAMATASTLVVALTSVLAYPAAMPTWYGLFAATWGLAFLVHAVEGGGRRWLAAAGAAAGISILFKVTGLYFLAAALLTLAWRREGGSVYGMVCGGAAVLFLGMLGRLVLPGAGPAGVVHFFLPGLAVSLALVVRTRPRLIASRPALEELARDVGALMAGVAAPVVLFLLPYLFSGSVGAWVDGVFLTPSTRFQSASSAPGSVWTVVPGAVAVGLSWWSDRLGEAGRRWLAWSLAAVLTIALSLDDVMGGAVFSTLWYSARAWIPWLTVWGAWVAFQKSDTATFAVVATAGLWALVQFPYTAPAYLFYVAPLGVLATLAVLRALGGGVRPMVASVAVLWLFLGSGYAAGVLSSADTSLRSERGGIQVAASDALLYDLLTRAVRARMDDGLLWVTPDAPEVYFLTGAPNPTPVLYEFLTPDAPAPDLSAVDVVVLNTRPLFSAPASDELRARLAAAGFVRETVLGPFEVHAVRSAPAAADSVVTP